MLSPAFCTIVHVLNKSVILLIVVVCLNAPKFSPLLVQPPFAMWLSAFYYFLHIVFIYLFLSALGLHCFAWTFSSCSKEGLLSSWGVWASHCSGFSCCGAQALSARASEVTVHGLSCSTAHGIFPDQGSNSHPLNWQADFFFFFLQLDHQGGRRNLAGYSPWGRKESDMTE